MYVSYANKHYFGIKEIIKTRKHLPTIKIKWSLPKHITEPFYIWLRETDIIQRGVVLKWSAIAFPQSVSTFHLQLLTILNFDSI